MPPAIVVRALFDFTSNEEASLSLREGDLIRVLTRLDSGWWDGLNQKDNRGWFPSNFTEIVEFDGKPVPSVGIPANEKIEGMLEEFAAAERLLEPRSGAPTPRMETGTGGLTMDTPVSGRGLDSRTVASGEVRQAEGRTSTQSERVPPLKQPGAAGFPTDTGGASPSTRRLTSLPSTARSSSLSSVSESVSKRDSTPSDVGDDSLTLPTPGGSAIPEPDTSRPLPYGWTIHRTEDASSWFYYNGETGEARWTFPSDDVEDIDGEDAEEDERREEDVVGADDEENLADVTMSSVNTSASTAATSAVLSQEPSLRSSSSPTAAAAQEPTSSSGLPPNWGRKVTADGKAYYYNCLTDRTVWTLIGVNPKTGEMVSDVGSAKEEAASGVPSEKPTHLRKLGGLPGSAADASANVTWGKLTATVIMYIHELIDSAKRHAKANYISQSACVVEAIRVMLYASGTAEKESPLVRAHKILKVHHRNIMAVLSKLVLSAKLAAGVWPPPDADHRLQIDANEVLLTVRHFVAAARDAGVRPSPEHHVASPVSSGSGKDDGAIPRHSSTARPQQSTPLPAAVNGVHGVGGSEAMDVAERRQAPNSLDGRGPVSPWDQVSRRGQQHQRENCNTSDLLQQLEQHSRSIYRATRILSEHAQRDAAEKHLPSPTSALENGGAVTRAVSAMAPEGPRSAQALIAQTRASVTEVGELLSLMEDLSPEDLLSVPSGSTAQGVQSSEQASKFLMTKKALYNAISGLVMATQVATDPLAPATVQNDIVRSAVLVETCVRDLCVITKHFMEERSERERITLEEDMNKHNQRSSSKKPPGKRTGEKEATRGEDRGASDADDVPDMQPRRAMSLNFLGEDETGASVTQQQVEQERWEQDRLREAINKQQQGQLPPISTTPATRSAVPPRSRSGPNLDTAAALSPTIAQRRLQRAEEEGQGFEPRSGFNLAALPKLQESGRSSSVTRDTVAPSTLSPSLSVNTQTQSAMAPSSATRSPGRWPGYGHKPSASEGSRRPSMSTDIVGAQDGGRPMSIATTAQTLSSASLMSGNTIGSQGGTVPWFLSYDYPSEDIVFTVDGQVKAGTFEALVQRLTLHNAHDASFNSTFMLCRRSFATNDEFFEALVRRFGIEPPLDLTPAEWEVWMEKKQKPIRLRMFNILKSWLENYYDENDPDDKALLYRLRDFAATTIHEHMPFAAAQLIKNIDKKLSSEDSTRKMILNLAVAAPVPILPKYRKRMKFTDINALEVARQLTILDSKLYKLIRPIECLQKAWSDKENPHRAPNIKAMIATSNHITGWVVDSILAEPEVKKRTALIKHFISVAEACRSLHNFNSLMSILAGLSSAPIHRLTRTWELVNGKFLATLDALRKMMSPTKNFSEYREDLRSRNPPAVPFLGVYLTDLTFIEDGNSDRLRGQPRLINFSKRTKTAEVIREIQQYQSVPYALTAVRELQDFLKRSLSESRDVQDMYNRSLAMEPRERADEKIARLLQESGFL